MAGQRISRGKRMLAAVSALALASAGMISLGGAAQAIGDPPPLGVGNINPDAKGSIILTKHQHQSGDEVKQNPAGDGASIGSDPIAGVGFTAYPITSIDLMDNDDWAVLNGLVPGADCSALANATLGTGLAFPLTDASGGATLANLAVGAYLVCETTSPAQIVDKATPFIVSIPFPHANAWLYDVHVYPKNGVSTVPGKTINPQTGHGLNDVVEFPVTSVVPQIGTDAVFSSYIIRDILDAKLGDPAVKSVTVDGATLTVGDDYEVAITGNDVKVSLNGAALAGLKAKTGKNVVVTFTGTVKEVGVIENTATVYINDPDMSHGSESNKVTTNWGDIKVLKVDSGDPAKTLSGAEFEIWEADAPNVGTCAATTLATATDPITVNGATTFTSDANGVVTIGGLYVSDSVNAPINAVQRCYVLVETKAPAGFVTPVGNLAMTPIAVKTGSTDVAVAYDATVSNVQNDVPKLPLTGAAGQLLMVAGGSVVLLVGAGLMVASRRRHRVEN